MSFDIRTVRASDAVVAAICGCWKRESSVNPGIWESLIVCPWDYMHTSSPLAGGFGLGQWTNTGSGAGMRCLNLHNWVTSHGYQDGEGQGQIAYLGEEDIWYGTGRYSGETSLENFLSTSYTNIEGLVWDFLQCWEGVPGNAYQERVDAANRFLSYIRLHANDDPSNYTTFYSRNGYLSDAEMLHNVMCVYFCLNGYLGGGVDTKTIMLLTMAAKKRRRKNNGKSRIQF